MAKPSSIDIAGSRTIILYGSTVVLRIGPRHRSHYRLVTPEESDFEQGLISTSSPIGKSLLNKEEGDEVKVVTPSGSRTFEVISLATIHDSE
jgi:transcription elongation factor GreA